MAELAAATQFWDTQIVTRERFDSGWMTKAAVRSYINQCIAGGGGGLWALDWLKSLYPATRFDRALSIGCGTGELDRRLIERDIARTVDSFDGGLRSLATARRDARQAGFENQIRYFAADFNQLALPANTYDLVVFNQSLHHVARMEKLLRSVMRSLTPDGLLYVDEYVGPSRTEWTSQGIATQQAIYRLLPRDWRLHDWLALPIEEEDPSEGIRSGEILRNLSIGFEITTRRDYGGTLLALLIPAINWDIAPADFVHNLIEAEKTLLRSGAATFYTVLLARPRRGLPGLIARCRYFLEPKIRYRVLPHLRLGKKR